MGSQRRFRWFPGGCLDMMVGSTHIWATASRQLAEVAAGMLAQKDPCVTYLALNPPQAVDDMRWLCRWGGFNQRLKDGTICRWAPAPRAAEYSGFAGQTDVDSCKWNQFYSTERAKMSFMSASSPEPDLHKLLLSEDPLDKRLQDHITATLWSTQPPHNTAAYFQYFKEECEAWRLSDSAVIIQTYQDFLDLVEHLKRTRNEKRSAQVVLDFFPPLQAADDEKTPTPSLIEESTPEQLNLSLRHRFSHCDPVSATNSIFLTVRLWLMLNVGSSAVLTLFPGRSSPEWMEDQSLNDFIDSCFPTSEWGPRLSQWPFSLNAYNLERVGGFELVWTDHLADHLYLDEDLGTIKIYHHVQALRGLLHAKSPDQALPDRLLLETLQTLALIIPRANRDCKKWFEKVYTKYAENIDYGAGDVESLHWARSPEKYKFWGQRLITIKMAYDASEPKNLGQWWHDRRRRVEWYTFWVAVLVVFLTIVFGLIQSITGVMQVYYAAHSGQSA